jgi:hypothetical protein
MSCRSETDLYLQMLHERSTPSHPGVINVENTAEESVA